MKISLLMIICNEHDRFSPSKTIESVKGVVDEIVIVVQKSQDDTLQLAKKYTDRVIEHQCYGYCEPSRYHGIQECSGDWILMLDADEELTEYGRINLRGWCQDVHEAISLRRITTIGGSIFEDLPHRRLFRKEDVIISDKIHAKPYQLKQGILEVVKKDQYVINQAKTWEEQVEDNRRYARLKGGFANFELKDPILRENTTDDDIWRSINKCNEYKLPDDLSNKIIIDVGAHIGAFAHACLIRGAKLVISVEPDKENFELLQQNLACFGQHSLCLRYAVWRSDLEAPIRMVHLGYVENTGGGSCVPHAFGNVSVLPLDFLIRLAGKVDLVKLDCEGAEWPILHTSKEINNVGRVIGEWHSHLADMFQAESPTDNVKYSEESLKILLERNFKVEWVPTINSPLGLFFASK